MAVTITKTDDTTRVLTRARTRPGRVEFQKTLYRSAYKEVPFAAGDGDEGAQRITVDFEVHDDTVPTIEQAAVTVGEIIADFHDAIFIQSPLGGWGVEGVTEIQRGPAENGYRLAVTLLTSGGRVDSIDDTLQFIDGSTWVFR